jgi:lipoate-protein ligase A
MRVGCARLIIDPPASGAWNMAVDEALLHDAAESGVATLRFSAWEAPTLSLGYFQAYDDREQHTASRNCACVRRQTGGGAIVHDREITYSVALPPSHPFARRSLELYSAVHDAFIRALRDAQSGSEVQVDLERVREVSSVKTQSEPYLCFERRAIGDVVVSPQEGGTGAGNIPARRDQKILGSAQRRSRGALLQHGSLLLRRSAAAPELAGFYDLGGRSVVEISPLQLASYLEEAIGIRLPANVVSGKMESNARELTNTKYGTVEWTKRR